MILQKMIFRYFNISILKICMDEFRWPLACLLTGIFMKYTLDCSERTDQFLPDFEF